MVLVIVQIRSETKLLKLAGSEHGNQSYAAGILENSLAIQGVYITLMHLSMCCPTLPLPGNIGGIVGI